MAIVYCSECEKQIPPGGLHEGRYFVVRDEPVCMDCYEELPDNIREGSIQLFVPESTRKRSATSLTGYSPEVREESERVETDFGSATGGLKAYAGWAVALSVIIAAAIFFFLGGC